MSNKMQDRALPPLPGQRPSPVQQYLDTNEGIIVNVDFFLPNGIMVTIPLSPKTPLREIKVQLFREARKMPLFSLLKDQGFYSFLGENLNFVLLLNINRDCGS